MLLSGPAWQHLALALLHTLWQGLAVAALLWLLLRRIPADRPEGPLRPAFWPRWSASCSAGWSPGRCWISSGRRAPASAESKTAAARRMLHGTCEHAGSTTASRHRSSTGEQSPSAPTPPIAEPAGWFPVLIAGWLAGVALMTARMVWMVARLRRLIRGPEVTDATSAALVDELRRSLHVRRATADRRDGRDSSGRRCSACSARCSCCRWR